MENKNKSNNTKVIVTIIALVAIVGVIFFVATNASTIKLPSHGDLQKLHG